VAKEIEEVLSDKKQWDIAVAITSLQNKKTQR
jgi:hypothetical protein